MSKKFPKSWNVLKSATQKHEVAAESVIQKFITDNYDTIIASAQMSRKEQKAIKNAKVMLVWQDER